MQLTSAPRTYDLARPDVAPVWLLLVKVHVLELFLHPLPIVEVASAVDRITFRMLSCVPLE